MESKKGVVCVREIGQTWNEGCRILSILKLICSRVMVFKAQAIGWIIT